MSVSSKNTDYIIFGDQSWPAESLRSILPEKASLSIWIEGKGWVQPSKGQKKGTKNQDHLKAAESCVIRESELKNTVAIVGFENPETAEAVVSVLKSRCSKLKVLRLGTKQSNAASKQIRRSIAWRDLLEESVGHELELLALQAQVLKLKKLIAPVKELALLIQDDPDPDGLAAALAFRRIMGRNAQTAPIVSFGRITRPENIAMSKLLDIEVITVNEKKLEDYEKVVMLDCQPAFFKGRDFPVHIVIDHHPKVETAALKQCEFVEIKESLGAVSTLMTFYIQATGAELSQRLATALLYGIKSDTLMFNREVSESDLAAFMFLYPHIKGSLLRRIERPDLPMNYIHSLRQGLELLQIRKGVALLPLTDVKREEWIAQAADFASQIENALWSVAVGVFQENLIICGRNWGNSHHCGEIFKKLFDPMGSAGGHKSMAKAVIPVENWEEKFGGKKFLKPEELKKIVLRKICAELREREED